MKYNDMFNDIPQSYFDYILREKRGKMNLEHFINSGYNEWMAESDLVAIELTEDEMWKYSDYYYSRIVNMPQVENGSEKDERTMVMVLFPGNHEWLKEKFQVNEYIDFNLYESITWNGKNIMDCELSSESDIILKAVLKPNITSFHAIWGTVDFKSVEIPSCITKIEDYGLQYLLDIQSITFAKNSKLEELGGGAITFCEHLTSIELPSSLKIVYDGIFAESWSLNSIICHATTAPIIVDMQPNRKYLPKSGTLYYPKGSDYSTWLAYLGEGWQGVEIWKNFDISSLRKNFVDGESYENEYNAIENFALQLNLKYNIDIAHIDIANQEIMYYDNNWNELTIDISQEVFFKDYLSQLTLNNTYDVAGINPHYITLYPSDGSHSDRRISPNNDYICEVQLPS